MTVNYHLDVSNSSPWVLFKLLVRWKGSLWKAVWFEYCVWISLFFIVSAIFHFALTPDQKQLFTSIADYLDNKRYYIPMDFMLGFFVTTVVNRWTTVFQNIGILDNVSLMTAGNVTGTTVEARQIRRNIVRYCVLSQCIVLRDISMQVRKRFPTLDTVVVGRFMMPHEKERFESINDGYAKHWMPIQWAMSLANRARSKNLIESDNRVTALLNEIKAFSTQMATLRNYDWVPLPVMYPQLVCLLVHTYFFLALISRQVSDDSSGIGIYFPVMSSLQFIFYIGWLKVAEALLNPLGEDDDDFECNWLLDRNLRIGLTIVDEGFESTPELKQDDFWENLDVKPLYAAGSRAVNKMGSTANVRLLREDVEEVEMFPKQEHDDMDDEGRLLLDRSLDKRRVSIVPPGSRDRSSISSNNLFDNLRRRLSRFQTQSKASTASLPQFNNGELGAYYNDTCSIDMNHPHNFSTPSTPKRITFEDSNGNSVMFDETLQSYQENRQRQPGSRRQSVDMANLHAIHEFPFAPPHSPHRHRVISDVINEAEETDQVSRHSSVLSVNRTPSQKTAKSKDQSESDGETESQPRKSESISS